MCSVQVQRDAMSGVGRCQQAAVFAASPCVYSFFKNYHGTTVDFLTYRAAVEIFPSQKIAARPTDFMFVCSLVFKGFQELGEALTGNGLCRVKIAAPPSLAWSADYCTTTDAAATTAVMSLDSLRYPEVLTGLREC